VFQVAAVFDPADPFARRFKASRPGAWPPGLRIGIPRAADLRFFGDVGAQKAFEVAVTAFTDRGAALVAVDMASFYATAHLLYEGPWVAERYAAVRAMIESDPDSMHPITRRIIAGATRFSAADTFEALYKLMALRRATEALWQTIDVLVVPTIPQPLTIDAVLADPIRLNDHLGTYTNFVNLLDLAALAVPCRVRDDGLPSGITMIAPSGRDGFLAGLGLALDGHDNGWPEADPDLMEIAVVGAHLSGLPLNGQITARGGIFRRTGQTAPDYRLFRLPGGPPERPGLIKVAPGEGMSVAVEIWALPIASIGSLLAEIPPPLGLGTVSLTDGSRPKGFICEADGRRGALDISHFGGWRAYLASLSPARPAPPPGG
jgi:allophanate hydrolase